MRFKDVTIFVLLYLCSFSLIVESEVENISNEWVVQIDGSVEDAQRIASDTGYAYKGLVRGFDDTYIFHKDIVRNKRDVEMHTRSLALHKIVKFVQHQAYKQMSKRDFISEENKGADSINSMFNDRCWPEQWYLHDNRTMLSHPKLDMGVMGAWKKNYTGRGVVVSIIDDGLLWNHTDLKSNYDPDASYDVKGNDSDPMPRFNIEKNRHFSHGTQCAGIVAMAANNNFCGVGVAFNAKIGGIRLTDGNVTDRMHAEALQHSIQHVDIFSCSWGPNDTKVTVEGPGVFARRGIRNGIKNGRNGKGSIYVWAAGNGGKWDSCSCDGFTSSVYTIGITSASQSGKTTRYAEKCASTIATTYSNNESPDRGITSTNVQNTCTTGFGGTSASAPLAAGIIALAIEANRKLTWRDVQHIAVWTSEPSPLLHNPGWKTNGHGLKFNSRFGFGLMNAEQFVTLAESWEHVPKQKICLTMFPNFNKKLIDASYVTVIKFKTDACQGGNDGIYYLEHIVMVTDLIYSRRGNLGIYLVSPSGTMTKFLSPRPNDTDATEGFQRWPFMSVHTWGENPSGYWRLEVFDEKSVTGNGSLKNVSFVFYGTTEMPAHYKQKRNYEKNYNTLRNRAVREEPWDKDDFEDMSQQKRKQLLKVMNDKDFGQIVETFTTSSLESDDSLYYSVNKKES